MIVYKLGMCSQDFVFEILMVFTIITGNVKKKVKEKKPAYRKECRMWSKISFEYNRAQQIERLPAHCSYLINKLIFRIRDLPLSRLLKFN